MNRIDDEYAAARRAYEDETKKTRWELPLKVGAAFFPPLAAVNEVREHFSHFNQSVEVLTDGLNRKIQYEVRQREKIGITVDELRSRVDATESRTSFTEACLQTLLTNDRKRVRRFGAILGGSVLADDWPKSSDDAVSFIKAIAQLAEKDIEAFGVVYAVQASVADVYPNLHVPDPFAARTAELLKAADTAGFHRDDFFCHCRRLESFGLALEVERNASYMEPGQYCFRPTHPGLKLRRWLQSEESRESEQELEG